jgi:hypothetical protein
MSAFRYKVILSLPLIIDDRNKTEADILKIGKDSATRLLQQQNLAMLGISVTVEKEQ